MVIWMIVVLRRTLELTVMTVNDITNSPSQDFTHLNNHTLSTMIRLLGSNHSQFFFATLQCSKANLYKDTSFSLNPILENAKPN